ncbi:NADH-quinone oxidoreductase subunit M [Alicyclobacillus sp.]|uniref:complex I subunit 4 family protein n=1 Tax=Alicyclobacillus sp. TaxID=61169 RepID=UPI0025C669C3|nr:NADH-quinone oxidoreductase subunit M [Alicyclobacillus sp.]MCL6517155.1 NADH-quinone oxidoreductase subunit M [Alicyclobacillus sp.]
MGIVFWIVLAPVIAAALLAVVPGIKPNAQRTLGLLGSAVSLVLALIAWGRFQYGTSGFQEISRVHWFTLPAVWQQSDLSIGLSFGLDGLSLPLVLLAAFISLLAGLAAPAREGRTRLFHLWLALATAGVLGVFTAMDLFTFLLALELSLFSAFFLILQFGEAGSRKAAFKFLLYRGLASVLFLAALVGLAYGAAGGFGTTQPDTQGVIQGAGTLTFDISALMDTLHKASEAYFIPHVRSVLFLVLLLGVLIEEAFVPFHTWLPTTHEHSDPATNMLIGGVLTKTGAYALLRFGVGFLPGEVRHWGVLIAVLGVINILYGAFAAWAQKDWRRLIAFGSISHMGLVLLGVAALNPAGLQGAMFMMVSSGLLTALLFFLTGAIQARTRTTLIPALGGLSKPMPMLSGFLLVAALGSLGLPLTSGFISEIQAFIGGFGTYPGISFVGVIGIILSAVYLLYAMERTTFGPAKQVYTGLADATPREYVPTVVLTALVLIIGVYPGVIGNLFGLSVQALLRIGG